MTRTALSRRIDWPRRATGGVIALVVSFCLPQTASAADAYALTNPAPKEARSEAQALAVHSGLLAPTIFTRQSFMLAKGGETLGSLVVGRASSPKGGATVDYTCFVAYIAHSGDVRAIMKTVGTGDWEAESCDGVKSVGLLSGSAGPDVRLGVVFDARSPNTDVSEPIVLILNSGKTLGIDLEASRKASSRGATDLKAMRTMELGTMR